MSNAICMCSTTDLYGPFIEEWLNEPVVNSDKFVIVDVTKDHTFNKGFTFTEQQLKEKFSSKVSQILKLFLL